MGNFVQLKSELNVYRTKSEGAYPVTESDWTRLKDLICKIIPEEKIYGILASIFGGISISSLFFMISLHRDNNTTAAHWIVIAGWIIAITFFIVCIGMILIDGQQKKMMSISRDFIIKEMETIEAKYVKALHDETNAT